MITSTSRCSRSVLSSGLRRSIAANSRGSDAGRFQVLLMFPHGTSPLCARVTIPHDRKYVVGYVRPIVTLPKGVVHP